jgi:hypothetical protein
MGRTDDDSIRIEKGTERARRFFAKLGITSARDSEQDE